MSIFFPPLAKFSIHISPRLANRPKPNPKSSSPPLSLNSSPRLLTSPIFALGISSSAWVTAPHQRRRQDHRPHSFASPDTALFLPTRSISPKPSNNLCLLLLLLPTRPRSNLWPLRSRLGQGKATLRCHLRRVIGYCTEDIC
jgi:hypothetical protein